MQKGHTFFNLRAQQLAHLKMQRHYDVVVIGGGATGLGCALDAATRGYTTLLLEAGDFGHATSSRSTKLAHGGVRYLAQGNLSLVHEALTERNRLFHNAPHLVKPLSLLIPIRNAWEKLYYGMGMQLYDRLAGEAALRSRFFSINEHPGRFGNLATDEMMGAYEYFDGQFDDARLCWTLARTAIEYGATVLNYHRVESLTKSNGQPGYDVTCHNRIDKTTHQITAKAVINATGIFADAVRRLDAPSAAARLSLSRGSHVVLPQDFLNSSHGLLVPKTPDGRVLFALPFLGRVLVGTTDIPVDKPAAEPRPTPAEIDYILQQVAPYLRKKPQRSDCLSAFAGLRPLVADPNATHTAAVSREHQIEVSRQGLVSIMGGKWTTYRNMAEETLDVAIDVAKLAPRACQTQALGLLAAAPTAPKSNANDDDHFMPYGRLKSEFDAFCNSIKGADEKLTDDLPLTMGHISYAFTHEMAVNLVAVLARRTRLLVLDAKASVNTLPAVQDHLLKNHRFDKAKLQMMADEYRQVAKRYFSSVD